MPGGTRIHRTPGRIQKEETPGGGARQDPSVALPVLPEDGDHGQVRRLEEARLLPSLQTWSPSPASSASSSAAGLGGGETQE